MKRKALITLIIGTALAIAPAANAMVMMPDSGGGEGTASAAATGGSSFDWGTAIPATLLGVVLLVAATLAVSRRRGYRLSF